MYMICLYHMPVGWLFLLQAPWWRSHPSRLKHAKTLVPSHRIVEQGLIQAWLFSWCRILPWRPGGRFVIKTKRGAFWWYWAFFGGFMDWFIGKSMIPGFLLQPGRIEGLKETRKYDLKETTVMARNTSYFCTHNPIYGMYNPFITNYNYFNW